MVTDQALRSSAVPADGATWGRSPAAERPANGRRLGDRLLMGEWRIMLLRVLTERWGAHLQSAWSDPPFQPLAADDPREIGGYRVLARLGAGGMGRVYLGSTQSGRRLAIKVIRPDYTEDPEFRRRFQQEIDAAQRVQSIYTAPVVDADTRAAQPWLATACIPGPSLAQAVRELGPLPVDTVRVLVAGVAEALQAVHRAGIVHRDLKPSNVLLAPDGPRVIDFGIARAADSTPLTRTGLRIGSPQFMSPEQARAEPASPASDVFALGATVYFAATGRTPFGEGPDATVLYRIVHEEPTLTDCPEPILSLVSRCLAKNPETRPSIKQVIETMTSDTESTTTSDTATTSDTKSTTLDWLPPALTRRLDLYAAPVETPNPPRRSWARRLVIAGGIVVGVLLIVGLAAVVRYGQDPEAKAAATSSPAPQKVSASVSPAASATPVEAKRPGPGRYPIKRQFYTGSEWILTLTYFNVGKDTLTAYVEYRPRGGARQLTCKDELPTANVLMLASGQAVTSKKTYCSAHPHRKDWTVKAGGKFTDYAVFPMPDDLSKPFTLEWQPGLSLTGKVRGILLR
jgi:serine/threonine protein kinase